MLVSWCFRLFRSTRCRSTLLDGELSFYFFISFVCRPFFALPFPSIFFLCLIPFFVCSLLFSFPLFRFFYSFSYPCSSLSRSFCFVASRAVSSSLGLATPSSFLFFLNQFFFALIYPSFVGGYPRNMMESEPAIIRNMMLCITAKLTSPA